MKTVLVVGANGGIGSQVVSTLLDKGYAVIGAYHIQTNKIDDFKSNTNFSSKQIELKDSNSVKQLADSCESEGVNLYAVVNCAGIVRFEGDNLDNDISMWNETMAVNLTGNFLLGKMLYPFLEDNGRFVMISSTDANFGGAITASYSASKSGVNSLTKSFSLLFQDKMIRVNSIAPGWVLTPMTEPNGEEFLDKVAAINPLKRNALPIDAAHLVKFLLSNESDYINGQVITFDGGYTNQDPTLLLEEETKNSEN